MERSFATQVIVFEFLKCFRSNWKYSCLLLETFFQERNCLKSFETFRERLLQIRCATITDQFLSELNAYNTVPYEENVWPRGAIRYSPGG